ncbi:unnamed protein product [Camellia sinensis]
MSRSAALIIVHMATPFVSRRKSTSPSFYTLCGSVSVENLEHVDHNGFTISTEDGVTRKISTEDGFTNWKPLRSQNMLLRIWWAEDMSSATFISDLADAVIESLPYVGAMAVSNLEARQSLVPLGSVEELLAAYDSQRRELPPPVTVYFIPWCLHKASSAVHGD